MIRVVIDTNVVVSAILAPQGTPARILQLALDGAFELIFSPPLIQEIQAVMRYPKIVKLMKSRGLALAVADDFIGKLRRVTINVPGKVSMKTIVDDPKDDMVLVCAIEGQANFIVSGDSHLTQLKTFQGIPVLDLATFARLIAERK